jgi:hypothetical protein
LRKRRGAAVFAVSLLAHIGVFAAWFSTHPRPLFVEPATMQIEMIRPPPRERPKPTPVPPSHTAAPALAAAPTGPTATTPPPPMLPVAPRVLDVRQMTDQELLERAGKRPDIAKVFADEARQPVFSRALGRNPEDMTISGCKPATERSRRIAPPCPSRTAPTLLPHLAMQLPNRPALVIEAKCKDARGNYHQSYGASGLANITDFPGAGRSHCTMEGLEADARAAAEARD